MLVGGGTGGHILPLLAVAHKLRAKNSKVRIIALVDEATKFAHLLESSKDIDEVARIKAGKLRRYPNRGMLETILDIQTTALNVRDGFRTIAGILQAKSLLRRHRPSVIFIKGGFVGVPVGIAAHMSGVPFITHDSDASPGLANQIIGRWAEAHAVTLDKSLYVYPASKTVQVGNPTAPEFKHVSESLKTSYRKEIGIPAKAKMIFVTGGSQGSQNLNSIVATISRSLIAEDDVYVVHQTGSNPVADLPVDTKQYIAEEYLADLYHYSGAADVIVSRAGSVVAEFALQEKAVIVVPAPQLADGHQLKNAEILEKAGATVVFDEVKLLSDPKQLLTTLLDLLGDNKKRKQLGEKLAGVYPPNAAEKIADMLLQTNRAGE